MGLARRLAGQEKWSNGLRVFGRLSRDELLNDRPDVVPDRLFIDPRRV
jgi:hypothetical protein